MAKIIGNTTATPNPQPDWLQTDDKKADYIKNKPMDYDAQMNAVSFGTNTHAGGMGYKITGIYIVDNVALGYYLDSVDELATGMEYSVNLRLAGYNCGHVDYITRKWTPGTITSINDEQKLVEVTDAPDILELKDESASNGPHNFLTIKGRPDLGTIDVGMAAFAEGQDSFASEAYAHAEGMGGYALGKASHVEGAHNVAGYNAHAEGSYNYALGDQSHAEGRSNFALGPSSHVEGAQNSAGKNAHAGGSHSDALGDYSFAHGYAARANGESSAAFGNRVRVSGNYQFAVGSYNDYEIEDAMFMVGNGETSNTRSNAFTVLKDGSATLGKSSDSPMGVTLNKQLEDYLKKNESAPVAIPASAVDALNGHSILNYLKYGQSDNTKAKNLQCTLDFDSERGCYTVTGPEEANNRTTYTIPGFCDNLPVVEIKEYAFKEDYQTEQTPVTEVYIQEGIKVVGAEAFNGCRKLTKLSLPETLTTVGRQAFNNCKALANLSLPSSIRYIGKAAFVAAPITNSIVIPKSCEWVGYSPDNTAGGGKVFSSKDIPSIIFEGIPTKIHPEAFLGCTCDIYVPWSEGAVSKPEDSAWGSTGTVYYNYQYATEQYVQDAIANVEVDLTGYATEQYVQDEIAKIDIGDDVNLGDYAKVEYVDAEIDQVNERIDDIDNELDIVQTTGYSETAVMSQKAVTETLEGKSVSETLTFNEMEYTSNVLSDKVEAHVQRVSGGKAFVEVNDEANPTYYEFKKTTFSKLVNTSKDQAFQSEVDFGSVELGWNDVLDVECGTKITSETATFTFPNVELVEEPIYDTDWEIDDSYTWWDDNENMICKFTYDSYARSYVISGPPIGCTHGQAYIGNSMVPIPVYKSLNDVQENTVPDYIYFVYDDDETHDHYYFVFITSQFGYTEDLLQAGDIVIYWLDKNNNDEVIRQDTIDGKYETGDYNLVYTNPGWSRLGSSVKVDWTNVGLNSTGAVAFSYAGSELQVSNDTNMLCNFITDKVEYSATSDKNKCTKNPFNAPMVYCIKDGAFVAILPGAKTLQEFLIVLWELQNSSGKSMQLYYETGEQTKSDISLDGSFVYHTGGTLKLVDNNGEVIEDQLTVELMQSTSGYLKQDDNNIARRDYVSEWFDWLNDYFGFTVGLEYALTDDQTAYSVAGVGLADGVENVVILPKFKNKDVVEIGYEAFADNTKIADVSMPDTITRIGASAFSSCSKITEIALPNQLRSIGNNAFCDCSELQNITMPGTAVSIGDGAFDRCEKITSVYITDLTAWCESLFANESANPLCYAELLFLNQAIVFDAKIPNSTISVGDYVFYNYKQLRTVDIGTDVEDISRLAFIGCKNINSFSVSSSNQAYLSYNDDLYNKAQTVLIRYASGKPNKYFEVPDNVEHIYANAFDGADALMYAVIPANVSIMEASAFTGCDNMTILCAADKKPNAWEDDWNRDGRPVVWGITLPDENSEVLKYTNDEENMTATVYCEDGTISIVTIPTFVNGYVVTAIKDYAFNGCSKLNKVKIPMCVETIGAYAFLACKGLTTVDIANSVVTIGNNAFEYCSGLLSVDIPNGVASIGQEAFKDCTELKRVVIPASVTQIGRDVFSGCNKVEILCKAESKPDGWHSAWSAGSSGNITWGYTGKLTS